MKRNLYGMLVILIVVPCAMVLVLPCLIIQFAWQGAKNLDEWFGGEK